MSTTVTISPSALDELKRLSSDQQYADKALRIGVKGGGCSGLTYIMDFDAPTDSDEIFDFDGLKVAVNRAQALYLVGTVLDFEQGLNNRGFTWSNPNAKDTCGCGTSFSI